MNNQPKFVLATVAMAGVVVLAYGAGSGIAADSGANPLTVPKVASCAGGGKPETALQGQVPAALRQSGFGGFNCNLELVGQFPGEGGSWSSAAFTDGGGRTCLYHATSSTVKMDGTPVVGRQNPGVPVIDITDPTKPIRTMSLNTPAMLDPWESLRVNARRQILVADNGANAAGGPEIDVYDLSGDCRSPQLLASVAVGTGSDGGMVTPKAPKGHEGNISPDGLTYYVGDRGNLHYLAVDLSNTTKPKVIASWDLKSLRLNSTVHGMSVSTDGTRVYASTAALPAPGAVADPNALINNGFVVLDTSEVQARKANAQIRHISTTVYKDGGQAQHTIPIKVKGKLYVVMVDEGGSGGLANPVNVRAACDVGLTPFPLARIFDMSDEKAPRVVSKLMLETHDPKNCAQVLPDIVGLDIFTYGSHYCSVDNRENATALACSYFNSGVRVFDIRNPDRPKEIAYYNPPAASAKPGSNHVTFGAGQWRAGGPDWCASRLDFDFAKKQLITMCQDNGVLVMRFAPNTWPFADSTASRDQS